MSNILSSPSADGVPYTVEVYAENSVGRGRESCNATDFNVQLGEGIDVVIKVINVVVEHDCVIVHA